MISGIVTSYFHRTDCEGDAHEFMLISKTLIIVVFIMHLINDIIDLLPDLYHIFSSVKSIGISLHQGHRLDITTFKVIESGSEMASLNDASVNIVLDTNCTIAGMKVIQISNCIKEIVQHARATVKFNVVVTDPKLTKIISKTKQQINVTSVAQQINKSCSEKLTNFYDAWGQTMNEIPYDEPNSSYLILFTNGVDTASLIYNLDTVINLLNQKLSRNPKLQVTFIQAGPSSTVINALQTKCTIKDRCIYTVVPDSDMGIRMGFEQVKNTIRPQLLQTSPYAQMEYALNSLSMSGTATKVHYYEPNVANVPVAHSVSMKATVKNAQKMNAFVGQKNLNRGFYSSLNAATSPPKAFKVWVGNLPMVPQTQILEYLNQWGSCRIETINGSPSQWAVVAYENQSAVDYAVKYGNGSTFEGQAININKI